MARRRRDPDAVVNTLFLLSVKARMQIERGKSSIGFLGSFRSLIREGLREATVLRWRHWGEPRKSPRTFWCKTFKALSGEVEMTQKLSILMGSGIAGATESFVVVPLELAKITQAHFFSLRRPLVTNPFSRQIVQKDRLLGLYSGMEATFRPFWRHLWWNGSYFGTIFRAKVVAQRPRAVASLRMGTGTARAPVPGRRRKSC
ncbi:hypothetical protein BC834DRAFT_970178 [Gloeopeniophorella convolvens]|nr:hypothetical protein BC834DRAFT_970178 [Gloeopeniophorella convolvens]